MMNDEVRVIVFRVSGFQVGSKGTLVLNFQIADFSGRWLVSINHYSHCVIAQDSQLLYRSP